jgi:PAS domain S-box-containing protein
MPGRLRLNRLWVLALAAQLLACAPAAGQTDAVRAVHDRTGEDLTGANDRHDADQQAAVINVGHPFAEWVRPSSLAVAAAVAAQATLIVALFWQNVRRRRAEQELRAHEGRYAQAVEAQSDLICRCLPDATLTFVNDAYCRFVGRTRESLIGRKLTELVPLDARIPVLRELESFVRQPRTDSFEHGLIRPDGSFGFVQWVADVLTDTTGVVTELEATGRDVSDRRRAEQELADHKAHTHALLCALPHLTFTMTREGVYLDYHAKDPRDLFVPPEQFLGKNIRDIMPPEIADKITAAFASLDDGPEPAIVEYSLPLNGEERHFEARLIAYGPDRILSVVRDITNRRRNEAALIQHADSLRASHERIQDLAGRLIASQEAERQRIARDLHDDLSQKLALLNIDIDLLARGTQAPGGEWSARVRTISRRTREIASDLHRLSHELHPTKLQVLGLVAAIQSVCHDVSNQHEIIVEFAHEGVPKNVPVQASLCLYRITQEALHNVVKHSGAKHAAVRLSTQNNFLYLEIADQGVGFTPAGFENSGLGLVSMRERTNFLGGRFVIHSGPGLGTRLGVRIPLDVAIGDSPYVAAESA